MLHGSSSPMPYTPLVDATLHALGLHAELGANGERAPDSVLVKPVSPIGPTEVSSIVAADLRVELLGRYRRGVEDWMVVHESPKNCLRRDTVRCIECDEEATPRRDSLQAAHVVGHQHAPLRLPGHEVVPARSGGGATRKQRFVSVQDDLVLLIRDRTEELPLEPVRDRPAVGAPGRYAQPARPDRTRPRRPPNSPPRCRFAAERSTQGSQPGCGRGTARPASLRSGTIRRYDPPRKRRPRLE